VKRAIKVIHRQETLDFNEDRFADLFGVSARHLRRVFVKEIGKTPKQLSSENRLVLARKLLVETNLTITEIAFASGFNSIRRFNDSFKNRFYRSPSKIRRNRVSDSAPLTISLAYRPPFDFEGLIHFYKTHQVGELERFQDGKMFRIVSVGDKVGEICISNDPNHFRLWVEIAIPDLSMIHTIIAKVRALFDLDSDPIIIANCLEKDPEIRKLLKKHVGIRLPSGWDAFEVGVSAILGQFVSVDRGRGLVAELIDMVGEDSGRKIGDRPIKLFPSPSKLASADLRKLRTTSARKETLISFASLVAQGKLKLEETQDVDKFLKAVTAIRGIGPWTATYMALKVLRHTDAFPVTDLIIARALQRHSKESIELMRPWRGYVASLFWREYSETLKKRTRRKQCV
jgi:AraC family transcriptional regulator of adaptative response / DNA-3-methyladenine glycosylase II